VLVQKAFNYRFFPSDSQAEQIGRTFGCACFVYNQALDYCSKAWLQEKKSLGYHYTALKLIDWKQEPEKAFLCGAFVHVPLICVTFQNMSHREISLHPTRSLRRRSCHSSAWATGGVALVTPIRASGLTSTALVGAICSVDTILNVRYGRDTASHYFVAVRGIPAHQIHGEFRDIVHTPSR
jgi:hypothetical protein